MKVFQSQAIQIKSVHPSLILIMNFNVIFNGIENDGQTIGSPYRNIMYSRQLIATQSEFRKFLRYNKVRLNHIDCFIILQIKFMNVTHY